MTVLSCVTQLQSCHSGQGIHQLFQIHVSPSHSFKPVCKSKWDVFLERDKKKKSPLPLLTHSKIVKTNKTPITSLAFIEKKKTDCFQRCTAHWQEETDTTCSNKNSTQIQRTALPYKGGQTLKQPVHSGCRRLLRDPGMAPRVQNVFG